MKIVLINPPLVGLNNDPFGGIPSLPVGISYLAAYLREDGHDINLIDAFGESPRNKRKVGQNVSYGLSIKEIIRKIDSEIVGISVHSAMQEDFCLELIKYLKDMRKFVFVGGAQPTADYSVYIKAGADYVILGEGEESASQLLRYKGTKNVRRIDGLAGKDFINPKTKFISDLDKLPFPAIDLLPLRNYWSLGYAHGPVNGRYLFLITSRGCPFNCNFCSAPSMWQKRWRVRSPKNVVDEIEYHHRRYHVRDFHIQDDNFTFDKQRAKAICREILRRKLDIDWQLPAGMKIETIDLETLELMKEAGCRYFSFSPESGSKEVLKLMNKPFNHSYAIDVVKHAERLGIRMQACFVIGYPGEKGSDLRKTKRYIKELTRSGVDEIAVYIMCPLPGANVPQKQGAPVSFSPRWRTDYAHLNHERMKIYFSFLFWKSVYSPKKMLMHAYNILTHRFETKIEMTLFRLFETL